MRVYIVDDDDDENESVEQLKRERMPCWRCHKLGAALHRQEQPTD
jgi:hypothetical protein